MYKFLIIITLLLFAKIKLLYCQIDDIQLYTNQNVKQYEKFEVGISLIKKDFSNPFDSVIVDVYAIFYPPDYSSSNGNSLRINAFWYKDFLRNSDSPDPTFLDGCKRNSNINFDDNAFLTPINTNHEWRIRFSNKKIGLWKYKIFAKYDGVTYSTPFRYFSIVKNSSAIGNVKVHENKQYFYEDNNNKHFIPIGTNCVTYDNARYYTRALFMHTMDVLNKMKEFGGNMIRIWATSSGYGIEWDGVSNIGKYFNRQNRAYDLDSIFEYAEKNNLKILLVLEAGGHFSSNTLNPQFGGWQGNPYKNFVSNVNNKYTIFLNNLTIKYFKQKYRYIISRWGYSNALLAYEMFNEIEMFNYDRNIPGFGGTELIEGIGGYWDGNNNIIYRNFIKNQIKYMKILDKEHMFTDGLVSLIAGSAKDNSNSEYYSMPELDFVQAHYYSNNKTFTHELNNWAGYSLNKWKKPLIFGEVDEDYYRFWCGSTNYTIGEKAHHRNTFHNILWSTLFSGSAGVGTSWFSDDIFNNCWGGQYKQYVPLNLFLKDDDFFTSKMGYYPLRTISNPSTGPYDINNSDLNFATQYIRKNIISYNNKVEAFALLNYENNKIYGWVHNKDNYWYNLPHSVGGENTELNSSINSFSPSVSSVTDIYNSKIKIIDIPCDGIYNVDFYSTYYNYNYNSTNAPENGGLISGLSLKNLRSHCGELEIPLPRMHALSIDTFMPDYALKIYKSESSWFQGTMGENLEGESLANILMPNIDVSGSDIFFQGSDNRLKHYFKSDDSFVNSFEGHNLETLTNWLNESQNVNGEICIADNSSKVFYKGTDNRLHLYYYDNNNLEWVHRWLTNWANNLTNVFGDITADYYGNNVFYVGLNKKIHRYYFNNNINDWVHEEIITSNGNNIYCNGDLKATPNGRALFYRGIDNRLHQCYLDGSLWYDIVHTNWSNNSQNVTGNISISNNGSDIYYVGPNNEILNYKWYYPNTWTFSFITDELNFRIKTYSSDLVSTNTDSKLFFIGSNGNIVEAYKNNNNKYIVGELVCSSKFLNNCNKPIFKSLMLNDKKDDIVYVGSNNLVQYYSFEKYCSQPNIINCMELSSSYIPSYKKNNNNYQGYVEIYPNPSFNFINLNSSLNIINVKVLNIFGVVVKDNVVYESQKTLKISLEDIPSGTYFLNIILEGQIIENLKFIKIEH